MCTNLALFSTGANTPYRITARTMDFAADLMTQLKVTPRGQSFPDVVVTPLTNPLKWTNQYGYVGMECGPEGVKQISDGLNEAGVSVGLLWLADSQYPTSESAKSPTIYNICLGDWILGNFASVAALKSALENVTVLPHFSQRKRMECLKALPSIDLNPILAQLPQRQCVVRI